MGIFDKVGSFLKREAKDLGDAAEGVKDKFDQELTKREQELEMTPSEKIAALQQQAMASDARFDEIADKATGRGALADAVAEVGDLPVDASLPNITHIVLPDGRVKSGNEVSQVVDASGAVHDVPVVEAPTADDLKKPEPPAPPLAEPEPLPERPMVADPAAVVEPVVVDEYPAPPVVAPEPPAAVEPEPVVVEPVVVDEFPAPPVVAPEPEPAAPAAVEPEPVIVEPEPAAPAAVEPVVVEQVAAPAVVAPEPGLPVAAAVEPEPEPPAAVAPVIADDFPAPAAVAPEPAPAAVEPEPELPVTSEPEPVAVAEEPPSDAISVVDPSSPAYGKTPAQLKYERARAAANNLLDELRGELEEEGEI